MAGRPDPILIIGGGRDAGAANDNVMLWCCTGRSAQDLLDWLAWRYDGFAIAATQGFAA